MGENLLFAHYSVIARLPERKPRNLIKKKLYFYPSRIITKYEIATPERKAFRLAMTKV